MNWDSPSAKLAITNETIKMGDSPYSVYEWRREGNPFYVGLSKEYRFQHASPGVRSAEFTEIYEQGNCCVVLIAYGMSEQDARRIEREQIKKRIAEGCKLVNKQYVVDYYHTPNHMQEYKRRRGMKYCDGNVKALTAKD